MAERRSLVILAEAPAMQLCPAITRRDNGNSAGIVVLRSNRGISVNHIGAGAIIGSISGGCCHRCGQHRWHQAVSNRCLKHGDFELRLSGDALLPMSPGPPMKHKEKAEAKSRLLVAIRGKTLTI